MALLLPYVQGISERIGRVPRQQQVKVAYEPQITMNSLFPRPKEQKDADRPQSGIVYKINGTNCDFCILWSNRKTTEGADYRTQKGCLFV